MCEPLRLIGHAAAVVALLGSTAACAQRPIGDLGRVEPGAIHDEVLPTIGKARAGISGEPVSPFNLADQEGEMRDRVWRFLISPHSSDWFFDVAAELQRTRLAGPLDQGFKPDRYYRWLRQTGFASSRARYNALADHVRADLGTLPATFRSICEVVEIDRQRGVAARETRSIGEAARRNALARKAENDMHIDWFVRAVTYRYQSYGYALDNLLVETPHEQAVETDRLLSELAVHVDSAQRGEFCTGARGVVPADDGALPSRVLMRQEGEQLYRK